MLGYQHGYHAGNIADVVKHLTLTRLLHYMVIKEKPLFYLETHAGRGLYDLHSQQALKTKEAALGIEQLWERRKQLPTLFKPYLQVIRTINTPTDLRYYPGSPSIAMHLLRSQDRLFFSELHPEEYKYLQKIASPTKKIHISHSDGMEKLSAFLPPPERRGLIFVDPSYEIKNEYKQIPEELQKAYCRFETGVFCLWYPIVDKKYYDQLQNSLKKINAQKKLQIEFHWTTPNHTGMTGCGLWIINPPYLLTHELNEIFETLKTIFNPGVSFYRSVS